MPGLRPLDRILSALSAVVSQPTAERGYEDLAVSYEECGMAEDAEAVRLLISEKFGAYDPGNNQEQH